MTQQTASAAMISTMKAYNIQAEDAIDTISKYNEVANNFSIDTEGLSDAIQRSGSALSAAGNTLDESLGLITAANDTVQNPQSVGTFLKTASMRLRAQSTAELEAAGIDTTGMTNAKKSIRAQFMAQAGIDIMKDSKTYKSTYQILDELADKWNDLSDAQQAAITEAVGGKRGSGEQCIKCEAIHEPSIIILS